MSPQAAHPTSGRRPTRVAAGGRFEVKNINGTVTIEQGTDEGTVDVRAERTVKASSDEAAQAILKQARDGRRREAGRRPRSRPARPRAGARGGHEVRYFIKVPKSIRVDARTTNGGVRLNGIANEVTASSVNGGIKGDGLSGHIDANTTNGGVEIGLTSLSDAGVTLETVNGGVQLQLPRTAEADISARVVNGGVNVAEDLRPSTDGRKDPPQARWTIERRRQPRRDLDDQRRHSHHRPIDGCCRSETGPGCRNRPALR